MCSRSTRTRTLWFGRGVDGRSAELKGSATAYFYGMQAFALAIVVHYTAS
jgi:hypothetical protein